LNSQRICILTSGHPPLDDRIFWKFGNSLSEAGFKIFIVCSTLEIKDIKNGIKITGIDGNDLNKNQKIKFFLSNLESINPEIIICEEMLPVFSAINYKKRNQKVKVILDITEWYPENVAFKFNGTKRWLKYFQLLLPYIFVLNKVDQLIIGEKNKKRRYDALAFNIPKTIIGYYPVLKYFRYKKPDLGKDEIIFGYAGVITYERGINDLLRITNTVAQRYSKKKFKLIMLGRFTYKFEEEDFRKLLKSYDSIKVELVEWTDYDKISKEIEKMDICFDLRKRNFIYKNSLPIKIFEYMACGKPFIFSDVKPIRDEIDIDDYGLLVNPAVDTDVINAIETYLQNPALADKHSKNSRQFIEREKNWENESRKLIDLINGLLIK
jgi:glycosyltransferase involved in cell wall biosynthesis